MATTLGLFGTGNFAANQRPENYREQILFTSPNGTAPITALTSKMKSRRVDDPRFHWWDQSYEARHLTENGGGVLIAGTALTVVAKGSYCPIGTLLRIPATGEIVKVTANAGHDTGLTISRAASGTTAVAIPAGAQISIMGNAWAEGTNSPSSVIRTPTLRTNYTQIWKQAVEHTRTMARTRTRTPDQIKQDIKQARDWHMEDLEKSFLFGKGSEAVDSNGQYVRTTDGALTVIQTNFKDVAGKGTLTKFDNFAKGLFKYGVEMARVCFCGNDFIQRLNELVRDETDYVISKDKVREYGMDFRLLETPYGDVAFRRHPLLAADPYYSNSGWFFSLSNIEYVYMDDTMFLPNVQAPDFDGKKDMFLTEAGFLIGLEETHGIVLNL